MRVGSVLLRYDGSVPVPPCTETVKYFVLGKAPAPAGTDPFDRDCFWICCKPPARSPEVLTLPIGTEPEPFASVQTPVACSQHTSIEMCRAVQAQPILTAQAKSLESVLSCWAGATSWLHSAQICTMLPVTHEVASTSEAQSLHPFWAPWQYV